MSENDYFVKSTKAQRIAFAQQIAASYFADFSIPGKNRGAAWTPDIMPEMVETWAKLHAATSVAFHKKHHEEVGKIAKDFYLKYLDAAMRRIG